MKLPGKQSGQAPPTWLWLTALISIAAFAALVMYLDYHQKRDHHNALAQNPKTSKAENAAPTKGAEKGKKLPGDGNVFDFYHLLPGMESIVGDNEPVKEKPQPTIKPEPNDKKPSSINPAPIDPTPPSQELYLQVGAYQQFQAADRMKASLAMLGFKASIQRVDSGTVGRVHRVRIGPYASVGDMRHDQQKLNAANIPSIMVRSKLTP